MDSCIKTPIIQELRYELVNGIDMPNFAKIKPGDDIVVLANDQYSAHLMSIDYFMGLVDGVIHVDGINPNELYSRCLSHNKVGNDGYLMVSKVLDDMIRDYHSDEVNFGGKFSVMFQADGNLGIKMYYSRAAFYDYLASINAPVKKIEKEKKIKRRYNFFFICHNKKDALHLLYFS